MAYMSKRIDVAVLGHGIVAHTLALLLAQERLKVAMVSGPAHPSAQPQGSDIRAYSLNPKAQALLADLRVWPEGDAVTPMRSMWVCDTQAQAGSASASFTLSAQDAQAPALAWMVDVPALEAKLEQAVAFQPGIVQCQASEVTHAALTVVCEGKHSPTRAAKALPWDRRPYPQTAVAARLLAQKPHGGVARQWFLGPDIVALLPIGGEHGHGVALVWSCAHAQAPHLLAHTDELIRTLTHITDHALGTLTLQGAPAAWPLERSHASRWTAPGLALCGDAAHAMHPLAGQGLNVGLADAAELARVVHEREFWRELGDLKLLRRYERARQAEVGAMGWLTDGLFGLFGQTDSRVQALRNWGMSGVDRLGPLKHWLARKAMGQTA